MSGLSEKHRNMMLEKNPTDPMVQCPDLFHSICNRPWKELKVFLLQKQDAHDQN